MWVLPRLQRVEGRDGYLRSVHRAAAPGATHYVLVFAKGAFPDELDTKPTRSTRTRTSVSTYWELDEIRPQRCLGAIPDAPFPMPKHTEEKGRMKMASCSPRTRAGWVAYTWAGGR